MTPAASTRVRAALGDRFPYSVPSHVTSPSESMILSRYPLTDPQQIPATTPEWAAVVTMPGIGPVTVFAVHPCNPLCGGGAWYGETIEILKRAEQLGDGPILIAGDFNSTDDHGPMRELADHGFVSVTDIVGAGWMPTYPSDSKLFPPLIEIDHMLVNSQLTALSISTFRIDGTDHLGLIAQLART
jgi:endonuclease/exonuclease/phosphatase family metal-dependent hydrolase